jgi:hypothetical protein
VRGLLLHTGTGGVLERWRWEETGRRVFVGMLLLIRGSCYV